MLLLLIHSYSDIIQNLIIIINNNIMNFAGGSKVYFSKKTNKKEN
jgi:hypothetical protein